MGSCCQPDSKHHKNNLQNQVQVPHKQQPQHKDLSKYKHYGQLVQQRQKLKKHRQQKLQKDIEKLNKMEDQLQNMKQNLNTQDRKHQTEILRKERQVQVMRNIVQKSKDQIANLDKS